MAWVSTGDEQAGLPNILKSHSANREADVQALLDVGLTARKVIDANQVVAYFHYVNRVADGLGVQLEDDWEDERGAPRA